MMETTNGTGSHVRRTLQPRVEELGHLDIGGEPNRMVLVTQSEASRLMIHSPKLNSTIVLPCERRHGTPEDIFGGTDND